MPNTYPYGDLVNVRFCFPSRPLTDTERADYAQGGNLPAGVGFDPDTVSFDHEPPGTSSTTTYTYPATILKEAAGQYHVQINTLTASLSLPNVVYGWPYKGYSTGNGQGAVYGLFNVERGL